MTYSQAWLESTTAIRKVFVIATRYNVSTSSEEQVYLSNCVYNTDDGIYFNPVLGNTVSFKQEIPISTGSVSIATGTVSLLNYSGDQDTWLDHTKYIWYNRDIKIYIGDPSWPSTSLSNFETKFKLVFKGLIDDIDGNGTTEIGLKIRSYLDRLNTAISNQTLSNTEDGDLSTLEDLSQKFGPIVLGEVFNIQPTLVSPGDLKYVIHKAGDPGTPVRNIESIIEIRDNGVPLYVAPEYQGAGPYNGWFDSDTRYQGTINLAEGWFKLGTQPQNTITCSVQGDIRSVDLATGTLQTNSYSSNLARVIASVLIYYGTTNSRLSIGDLDLSTFNNIDTAFPVSVGTYITSRDNLLPALDNLVKGTGIHIAATATGKVALYKLGTFATGSITTITADDIAQNTLVVSARPPVVAAVKLNYSKNWTIQTNLQTAVPDEHKQFFDTAYKCYSAKDETIAAKYLLPTEVAAVDSLLINKAEVQTIAESNFNYFKTAKTVYSFKGSPKLLGLVLGQSVTLKHHRFGLQNGVSGQVIGITPDYSNFTTTIEVIV